MASQPLPKPVLDPKKRSKVTVDPDHGLWGFFREDKKALNTPEETNAFGRPWVVEELRHKSWEDLHSLWWLCCKERNILASQEYERKRLKAGFGDAEIMDRNRAVKQTQKAIKHALTERHYAFEEARRVAVTDEEVDLKAKPGSRAYTPVYSDLFKKYGNYNKGEEPWKKYGRVNDWNIDLVPKLLMSNGELTNILVATDVTRYLEFKQIAGSYVQQGSGPKATVAKVPSDAGEALRSPLMGLFEKRRAKKFLEWVGAFKEDDPATYGGLNLNQCTMKEVYDKFGLEATTRDFIGHSMALFQTDDYILQKGMAKEAVQRIRLYVNSMARYGKSPYIYPLYGLGELPQGFARLSAIYGGTYMLNTSIDEVLYEGGRVSGIKATMRERGDESEGMKFTTKTKKILADPSYFPGKVQAVGSVLKAICILNHPVANTDNSDSAQLIIPQSQVGRKNDIYIAIVSSSHNVCPRGYYIAIVSTIAEGSSNHHLELQPGFDRLGKIEEKFMGPPIPLYEPLESGMNDNIFISKSYDATSHFETTTDDIRDIYRRAQGEELVVEGLREGQNLVAEE
ncbi:MAG: hypothetical protein LQ338_005457 [Usnochroma carphineum]|nr:MAG: hypothetical protein LQ338_005457 [Usnochroma carphineum]